jgi:restriction system protein
MHRVYSECGRRENLWKIAEAVKYPTKVETEFKRTARLWQPKHVARSCLTASPMEDDSTAPLDNLPPGKSAFLRPPILAQIVGTAFEVNEALTLRDEASAVVLRPLPAITLDAVLTIQGGTPDGTLIQAVGAPWLRILDMIERDPEEVYRIDSRQWEEIIAGAYKAAGFDEVVLTPRSGDLGRDVIATRRGMFSVRIIDQVKAYGPGRLVTADDVRSVHGVLAADVGVSKAVISTTSEFAPRLKDDRLLAPLFPHRIELHPKDVLLPWLSSLRNKVNR